MSGSRPGTEKTKIAVFGGGGRLGRHIVAEALRRGHTVTVATPEPAAITDGNPDVSVVAADVTDPKAVIATVAGHDVVVSAVGPSSRSGTGPQVVSDAAQALLVALPQAGGSSCWGRRGPWKWHLACIWWTCLSSPPSTGRWPPHTVRP